MNSEQLKERRNMDWNGEFGCNLSEYLRLRVGDSVAIVLYTAKGHFTA